MTGPPRPHVLGIDDAPFDKGQPEEVPIVAVMMECGDLVEAIALAGFPVDGAGATDFLAGWIQGLRFRPTLQGIVLGGITIAGLGVIDIGALADVLAVPVLVATRRDPADHRLHQALEATGLADRIPIVERTPAAFEAEPGLFIAHAGAGREQARALLRATLRKSKIPEPLRVAHLIARALVRGESRGRP